MFYHYAGLAWRLDATKEQQDRALEIVKNLGNRTRLPGMVLWAVEENLDTRGKRLTANRPIVYFEIAHFIDEESFVKWRDSPEHKAAAAEIGDGFDWVIIDIREPTNLLT